MQIWTDVNFILEIKNWIELKLNWKVKVDAGSGDIINYPYKTQEEIFIPWDAYYSNYVAVIDTAIIHINHTLNTEPDSPPTLPSSQTHFLPYYNHWEWTWNW